MGNIFKFKISKIAVLAIIGVVLPFSALSQDNVVRKVYSGELNLRDIQNRHKIDNGIEEKWNNCEGSYQYITSADGSRIFDGYFKFRTASGCEVEGEFKQNKQVGLWEYRYSPSEITRINFVDGIPQGEFVVHNPRKVDLRCEGMIQNGKLHSYFIWKLNDYGMTIKGFYNREGKPIDKWWARINKKDYTSEYDQNGNIIKKWHRIDYDESTGDKKYIYANFDNNYSPVGVGHAALEFIYMYTLRDSKLMK